MKVKRNSFEHYWDDISFVGKAISEECFNLMSAFGEFCDEFGMPLAEEKTV